LYTFAAHAMFPGVPLPQCLLHWGQNNLVGQAHTEVCIKHNKEVL